MARLLVIFSPKLAQRFSEIKLKTCTLHVAPVGGYLEKCKISSWSLGPFVWRHVNTPQPKKRQTDQPANPAKNPGCPYSRCDPSPFVFRFFSVAGSLGWFPWLPWTSTPRLPGLPADGGPKVELRVPKSKGRGSPGLAPLFLLAGPALMVIHHGDP